MKRIFLALALVFLATQANAAAVFWSQNVTSGGGASCGNGTFKWDADSGTAGAAHKCWATLTGGTIAAAAPSGADTVTFDASSGGGTVTVGPGYNPSFAAMTISAWTGVLDLGTNNNNITFTTWTDTGTQSHTVLGGSGAFTGTNTTASVWSVTTTTSSTYVAGTVNLAITPASMTGNITIAGGAKTYGNVALTFPAVTAGKIMTFGTSVTNATTMTVTGGALGGTVQATTNDLIVTGALTSNGSSSAVILWEGTTIGAATNVCFGSGSTATFNVFSAINNASLGACTSANVTATSSYDLGGNTGFFITGPTGGGGGRIIGG